MGSCCFENVDELALIGLSQLESVVIGRKCFADPEEDYYNDCYDSTRHFHLKNCEKLRELKIGPHSFSDYTVCEIENVPSLEVIEMGELKKRSDNFYHASLAFKSEWLEKRMMNRHAQFEISSIW